jgi:hypothetical protein
MIVPELSEHQRDLMTMGLCPFCEQRIRNWKAPVGCFAPEAWAAIRENGRDPANGHLESCKYKKIKLEDK